MKVLLIDNFDSFTYNVYHYIQMCGVECHFMRNDEQVMDELEKNDYSGIVFSPGPMKPENHPIMFEVLAKYHTEKPILGICLGHQAIGQFFGANVIKAPKPVHGKISKIHHAGHDMFSDIPENLYVARYHSLVVSGFEKTDLCITSTTDDGLPMSFAHKELPLWGVQFHPEAIQTEHGLKIFKNWTSIFS
jgi:anthranilate synthase/aminodeoxychorismate synthase-like glutamine amidotransferase